MDLIKVFQRFPDHESCLEHLEKVRWGDTPQCPYCNSDEVASKADGQRVGRWNCHACKSSFNVLSGTIFQKTKIPLQKWFLAIALIINAKKSLSSHQLARDLDMNQKSAWFMAMRIRKAMVDEETFLHGIVEADETYIGGKPRRHRKDGDDKPKRGRGTDKLPVIGAVERHGKVVATPSKRVTGKTLRAFLSRHVDSAGSMLISDEFSGYRNMNEWIPHFTVHHSVTYTDGLIHTNTIEGFWSLVKRAFYGQHHHYSKKHAASYIVEACYKYNNRKCESTFFNFIQEAMSV